MPERTRGANESSPLSEQLAGVSAAIRHRLTEAHHAREQALPLSRAAIRLAADAIRAVHRGEVERARALVARSGATVGAARAALREHTDVLHAGFVHDAEKEYAEAALTLALVVGEVLPLPELLGVSDAAYLNGLGEAVGELRRSMLDALRSGEMRDSERLLVAMDDLYSLLVTIDFPDALTHGLRRTTDLARGILERSRGDLTLAAVQHRLAAQLSQQRDQQQ